MRQVRKYDLVDLVLKVRNFGEKIAFCSKSPQFGGENYCLLIKKADLPVRSISNQADLPFYNQHPVLS